MNKIINIARCDLISGNNIYINDTNNVAKVFLSIANK